MRYFSLILAVFALNNPASAAPVARLCSDALNAAISADPSSGIDRAWLTGFAKAVALANDRPAVFPTTGPTSLLDAVLLVCKEAEIRNDPAYTLEQAAITTLNRARPLWPRSGDIARQIDAEGGELPPPPIYRDSLRAIQQSIIAAGYEIGSADGVIGPRTSAAIIDLHQSVGLPPDSAPSGALIYFLTRPEP